MIEVKDRVPKKPNRILIKPENGSAPFYATWERADEPVEEGTPINRMLFESIEEGGFSGSNLDDIEITAKRVTTNSGWTEVTFDRPLSGTPRVFVSVGGAYTAAVKNATPTGCMVAVYGLSYSTGYVASTSGGNNTKNVSYVSGTSFVSAPVDILAIYDGGVNV